MHYLECNINAISMSLLSSVSWIGCSVLKKFLLLYILQLLYDAIDPDKDTFQTRQLSKKEVLDREYSLLQKVGNLLEMANFTEIPREELLTMLHDRDTSGITVSVNHSDYEHLQVWTKGLELKKRSLLSYMGDKMRSMLNLKHVEGTSVQLYTRVFLAVRSRGEKLLHLKVFKEVHADKLERLLPKGKIRMSAFDKRFLMSSVFLGACLPLLRVVPFLSELKVQWVWGGVGVAAFIACRAWIGYKNKRNQYLASLATTLYYQTISNNRGVLALLSDRAQDEEVKEVILAYTFLLNPLKAKDSDLLVYDTPESLKLRVEDWLNKHFQLQNFSFDIDNALAKVDDLGLLMRKRNGTLTVATMREALAVFPESAEHWKSPMSRKNSDINDQMEERTSQVKELPGWS